MTDNALYGLQAPLCPVLSELEQAVMNERERCAKIAEKCGEDIDHDECCCGAIADQIRKGESV